MLVFKSDRAESLPELLFYDDFEKYRELHNNYGELIDSMIRPRVANLLFKACKSGRDDVVGNLLSMPDIDFQNMIVEGVGEGRSILQAACENGKWPVVYRLIGMLDQNQGIDFLCKALGYGLSKDQPFTDLLNIIIEVSECAKSKDFTKWLICPLKDNQSPLDIVLNRYHLALVNRSSHVYKRRRDAEKEIDTCGRLFETMLKALNQDQIKTFFLPSGNGVNNKLHLLGNIKILNSAVNALGDSGESIVEEVTKGAGHENLLHAVFKLKYVAKTHSDDNADMIKWLDDHYGLQAYLKALSDKDHSTPLHRLFEIETSSSVISPDYQRVNRLRENMLKRIGRNDIHGKSLIECLKIANKKGETPLHQLFSRSRVSMKVVDCLFEVLKPEELSMLTDINDQKGKSAMDYCREKHNDQYRIILQRVQNKV